jgi:cytochrome c-type biogenesis protein CcmF
MAFSLSLIGTFLVRSGVLSSVHSFATDPERGFFILVMIGIAIGGALLLFAWRAPKLAGGTEFQIVSRETSLLFNNLLLSTALFVVFVGTLYPLLADAVWNRKMTVGAPYFAAYFAPVFIALLILVPFGPRLAWRQGNLKDAMRVLAPALAAAAIVAVVVFALAAPRSLAAAGAFALATWVIGASLIDAFRRKKARTLNAAAFASILAHAGLGVTLLGVTGTTVWRSEAIDVLSPGQVLQVGSYSLRFDGVEPVAGPNYRATRAHVTALRDGAVVGQLAPEKRSYPAEGMEVSDTAIRTTGFADLYVALGDDRGGGRWVLRAYDNPLAPFIWFGGAIMALGGFASLWGRIRLRAPSAAPIVAPAE